MESHQISPADGCTGGRAGGRSPRHQRHRARAEKRLSLVRLPGRVRPPTTIYNRFVRWARRGIWESLFRELAENGGVIARLICRVKPSKRIIGDKAYDSAELRAQLDERGTNPIIPNRCNRKQPFTFSRRLYKLRWRIESAFNRLKDFRRIATRYDRLARNYLASVCLAAALVWWV